MKKIVIGTTVPETFATILKGQPSFLNQYNNVTLITSPGNSIQSIKDKEGVKIHLIPMERGISPLKDIVAIIRAAVLLRRLQPEILHSYTPKAGLVLMIAGFLARVPIRIHTFTGLIFPTATGFKKKILLFSDKLICAFSTTVIPEGEGVKKDLQRYRITRKPLNKIGNGNIAGVDTGFFLRSRVKQESEVFRAKYGISKCNFLFCYVGRLNKDKGIRELIESFLRLPNNVSLLMVGGLDLSAPIDVDCIEAIKTHPRIYTVGFLEDVRSAISASNVLVLPSYREGFPNVLLEAGALERPVIATNINGSNEIISDGVNGWLVPAKDSDALYEAMLNASKQEYEILKKMGEKARANVKLSYERSEYWVKLRNFYDSVSTLKENC